MSLYEKKIDRVYERLQREKLREKAFKDEVKVSEMFNTDPEIIAMRSPFSTKWLQTYESAFKAFERGDWDFSKEQFAKVLEERPNDKPTKLILEFMQNTKVEDFEGHTYFDE